MLIAGLLAMTGNIAAPIAFAHVSVRARSLDESLAWYTQVLGLRVALRNAEQAFTTFDEEHHRVTYFPHPEMGRTPGNLGGFDHVAFCYASAGDLLRNYRRLRAQGIWPHRSVRYGPVMSIYYLDPNGLAIELTADYFQSVDELARHLAGGCLWSGRTEGEFDPEALGGAATEEIVRPRGISHMVLKTARYEEMIEWYGTVMGCRVEWRCDRAAFLAFDYNAFAVAIMKEEDLADPGDTYGFDHCAFEYASMEDLAVHTYLRLKRQGIYPYWAVNHGMTTSLYYADPDLNRIELQVDNFRTKAECWQYITGPHFARNPIGVDLDPDHLAALVRRGASYEEMHRRVEGGPRTAPIPSPKGIRRA